MRKEWRQLKNFARSHYSGVDAHSLWKKIFMYGLNEFKNVCPMIKKVFSLSASNSTVERAFSFLTLLLSDKRLSLKHETIESLMKLNLSDKILVEKEKNEILERAIDIYVGKRRRKKVAKQITKVSRMERDNENIPERLSFYIEIKKDFFSVQRANI